jgi:deazaflavin-dependent oxidoreductase (nitroreductase family)
MPAVDATERAHVIAARRGAGIPARALNRAVMVLVGRLGVPVPRVWVLRTTGNASGRPRETPVLVLSLPGRRYLVSPRGATRWSRNLAAQPRCSIRRAGRVVPLVAHPVERAEAAAVIGVYLRRYGWLTRRLFGAPARPRPEDLARLAEGRPVVRLAPPGEG